MGIRSFFGLASALWMLPGAASAVNVTLSGEDVLTQFTASSGILTFSDSGGAPGLVTADSTNLLTLGDGGADVFFDAVLSDFRFNGTTAFDPLTENIRRGNFVGRTVGSYKVPTLLITDGQPVPTTLLRFEALVYDNEFTGSGGPRGGLDVSGATVVAAPPNDPDGAIAIGGLDTVCPTDIDGLCHNELELVGGSLAALFGGIGSIGHLNLRLVSPNPDLTSLAGYFGNDFVAGNGLQNAPTVWELTIVPIPEPGTFSLMFGSLLLLAAGTRRLSRGH